MPLTPNNREEHWLQGMVDGSTNLEPNNRKEHWYKDIVDAIGSGGGGGGGGGGGVLVVNVEESDETILTQTWQEIYDAYDEHKLVMLYWENDIAYLTNIHPATGLSPYYSVSFITGAESFLFKGSNATDYPVFDEH